MLRPLSLALSLAALTLICTPAAGAAGSFTSSDDLLNQIWQASEATATDTISKPVNLDSRGCQIALPLILLDSPIRDRCPWIGDAAVDGLALLLTHEPLDVLRDTVSWFASVQSSSGSIPASPYLNHTVELTDYNAYWIETLYDYTLYTGDMSLLTAVYPNLIRLVDGLYQNHVDSRGLLVAWLPDADYAGNDRSGAIVSYFNAQYARALAMAAQLAVWNGDQARATSWRSREQRVADVFGSVFWDADAGAFKDTSIDSSVHPQDGNSFAILAGLATAEQAQSALAYMSRAMTLPYGEAISDSNSWWYGASQAVYPFISYYDVLARYAAGSDASALELLRREWGYMVARGSGTMWESIGPTGTRPATVDGTFDHGWSSGAAPILTNYVLGIQPTSPGFATFTVTPHPGDLTFARGDVPTPHGTIHVSWTLANGKPVVSVTAPAGTTWANDPAANAAPALSKAASVVKATARRTARITPKPKRSPPKKAHS